MLLIMLPELSSENTNDDAHEALLALQRDDLARRCELLGPHTTMRVGGAADWWAEPQNEDELRASLRAIREAGVRLEREARLLS
jgi:hypothetical protein